MPNLVPAVGCRRLLPLLMLSLLAGEAAAIEVGADAPPIALPDVSGKVFQPAPGKVRWVDFWAAWCAPCRHSFPWMNEMADKYAGRGFEVLAVNLDTEAPDAAAFLAKVPARFNVVYDPEGTTPALYGVKGMPTSVLIGRDGKVRYQHIGFTDQSRETLEAMILKVLEETP